MHSLLIANRGEIARRVIRTARAQGIRTIAVFTEADRDALHVHEADLAVQVPGYLDIASIVAAATDNADPSSTGVHPGYGFLSENAAFARAVEEAGLVWVGPQPQVIDAMGRKDRARAIAEAAGVPVVPRGEDAATAEPDQEWGPVLVKAAAGGGGKGMRVVRRADELPAAMEAAAREAAKAFGDDTLLIEKYVERGRHIEVQVFGDTRGNVVHLFERDCSPQRRHQKVLEEAPAPTLTEAQRTLVTTSAVALARQVGYQGAGTVEFLLDAASGAAYFLEMNTRLQVEHPVTEEVVRVRGERLDLVALQLRIADGEPLGFTQDDVTVEGHAIEARVYAEDAWGGFLPQAGTATYVSWPGTRPVSARGSSRRGTSPVSARHEPRLGASGEGARVRVDHALASGQVVGTGFDPMLGKVIAVGTDREEARRTLVAALDDTVVLGLTTNTGFLRHLAASDAFRDAEVDTAWLDRTELARPDDTRARLAAGWAAQRAEAERYPSALRPDGWRDGGPAAPVVRHGVEVPSRDPHLPACVRLGRDRDEVVLEGERFVLEHPGADRDHAVAAGGDVLAPMPGTVLAVRVEVGQQVARGDVLGVLEAMKMELSLTAPFDGTVTEVAATPGAQVALGARLFEVVGAESTA
ncbi:ATP-binding protein [Nocardioides jiangxiensis]|uniref:Biotin carboxylase N-terminal domain-containing protein n=1 Tax=Nocardioides jiangxiensis TaxID=3064524 RepID=A0ABT9B271_9ACTN|nr:biotin carboxylase N-terminal domain-containing protein [Nocardioides sp. WY-20]MDO7868303.1 biotin carboxylase N-terminal domain-containing protein [Nocardioides sp. WY-20]